MDKVNVSISDRLVGYVRMIKQLSAVAAVQTRERSLLFTYNADTHMRVTLDLES